VARQPPVRVDVRVIAATNRDLPEVDPNRRFPVHLYYRLNVFPIDVPHCVSEVPIFLKSPCFSWRAFPRNSERKYKACACDGRPLMSYSWPGNIRELQNVIERAVILSQSSVLELEADVIPILMPADSSIMDDQSNAVEGILLQRPHFPYSGRNRARSYCHCA